MKLYPKSSVTLAAALALSLSLVATRSRAATLSVPSATYPTIQSAINAANNGDTIMVGPGTYGESLTWVSSATLPKDLTIIGSGAASCIIDPTAGTTPPGGRCMYTDGLSSVSSISGFTFQNGKGSSYGGGMANFSSSANISNCTFRFNQAIQGGGMYNSGGSPQVTNCMFSSNQSWLGGGMRNDSSFPAIAGCTFDHNHARVFPFPVGGGGGISNRVSSVAVDRCVFSANSSDLDGGGIDSDSGVQSVTNCLFSGNSAVSQGGGIRFISAVNANVVNCAFVGNSAGGGSFAGDGGGIFSVYSSSLAITNCTLSGNRATTGGGIENASGTMSVTNSIVWGNTAASGNGNGIFNYMGTVTISASDDQDLSGTPGAPDANGNFNADPLFVRNPNPGIGDFGDLRLRPTSPCIDKGNNDAVTSPPFTMSGGVILDLDGNVRIVDGNGDGTATVDMGAYEFQPIILQALAKVQALIDQVKAYVEGGAILPATGQSLYAKLDAAIAYLQTGDVADAKVKLQDFINQVKAFVKTGRLSASQGNSLITSAQAIITLLGG